MSGVEKPNNIRTVLKEYLRPITTRMAVATSGGIDSASIVMAAKDLGKNNSMILRNHGLLTCGKTIGEEIGRAHV